MLTVIVDAVSSVVEGAAVPAAAVVVGAGAVMARLGRETLMPESFITMAGRIVQIRIREGRRTKILDLSCSQKQKVFRRGAQGWARVECDRMDGGEVSVGGGRGSSLFGGGRGDK